LPNLLEALARLDAAFRRPLVLMGRDWGERAHLEARARELGVSDLVRFLRNGTTSGRRHSASARVRLVGDGRPPPRALPLGHRSLRPARFEANELVSHVLEVVAPVGHLEPADGTKKMAHEADDHAVTSRA